MTRFVVLLLLMSISIAPARADKNIEFGGLRWNVRDEKSSGPGPNSWNPANVWLDENGWLHLKIAPPARAGELWQCAEIYTDETYGFGRYQWQIVGHPDGFDPQVVLGLFNYPAPATGADANVVDGTNEIDIEFSRWGHPNYSNGNYTIWPAVPNNGDKLSDSIAKTFEFKLGDINSTHSFDWSPLGVEFWSRDGLEEGGTMRGHWRYVSPRPQQEIPQQPLPLHLNLWLAGGKAPRDGKGVEIVVRSFSFVPRAK